MMDNERIFIIGDIHGCLEMLKRLMERIAWHPERDGLIFLGDYIDRGKDSKDVVDYILAISKISSSVCCLKGNHEAIFQEYLAGDYFNNFLINGGDATLDSYRLGNELDRDVVIPSEHIVFLQSLSLWIELPDYYVVHAGFRPGVSIEGQTEEDMVWIRDPFLVSDYDFGKRVIFGHSPFPEPFVMDNKIGLDTGAVYGNMLTCLELPDLRFHYVEA